MEKRSINLRLFSPSGDKTDQSSLADTLWAVDAEEEWRQRLLLLTMRPSVVLETLDDEWDAMLRLVVWGTKHDCKRATCQVI